MSTSTKQDMMAAVVTSHVNSIPVAPSGTADAFVQVASHWLGKWWRHRDKWRNVSPGYCALVCDPDFVNKPAFKHFEFVDLFREMPSRTMGGAVYVTDEVLGQVYRKRGSFDDAAAIAKEILAIGLADVPTVIFEPEVGTMLLAQAGVKKQRTVMQLGSFNPALTVENVDKQLTFLHTSTLKYPTNFPQIWFDAPKFIPIFEAEKLFQSTALIHLRAIAQDNWFVRPEDDNNAGRTDISISTINPTRVFVLEIKVLKSFRYNPRCRRLVHKPEENEAWADSGITQVIGYRTAQQAEEAFLIMYDMRQKDEDLPTVNTRCIKEKVQPRRYFIFNATAARVNKAAKRTP